jgi:hypothetical protein
LIMTDIQQDLFDEEYDIPVEELTKEKEDA